MLTKLKSYLTTTGSPAKRGISDKSYLKLGPHAPTSGGKLKTRQFVRAVARELLRQKGWRRIRNAEGVRAKMPWSRRLAFIAGREAIC